MILERAGKGDPTAAEELLPLVYPARDPVGAQLISLRFFAGLPNHEAAALLGVPERTAKRTWAFARAWLYSEIRKNS